MKQYIPILKQTGLFAGISDSEIEKMAVCLQAEARIYKKGEFIYRSGDFIQYVAVLVEGEILIQKDDYWGNRSIVDHVSPGEIFGEAYAMGESEAILNDVIAQADSVVLFLNLHRMLTICKNVCTHHQTMIENLIHCIGFKNRTLTRKIDCLSKRTTRDKLTCYLSSCLLDEKNPTFEIPFNRQQLADYLGVDRSAMSNELGKMRDEGMIVFRKNRFTLLNKTDR